MKRVPPRSAVKLSLPSTQRRKELKSNPLLVETIDEEVWMTRSRISALNGVLNTIVSIDSTSKKLSNTVPSLVWGVFGSTDQKNALINKKNIDNGDTISEFLETIPSHDFHKIHRSETSGFYVAYISRNGQLLGGLARQSKAETMVALLAIFAIHGLNEKLEYQLQKAASNKIKPDDHRVHMIARLSGIIPNEELEE